MCIADANYVMADLERIRRMRWRSTVQENVVNRDGISNMMHSESFKVTCLSSTDSLKELDTSRTFNSEELTRPFPMFCNSKRSNFVRIERSLSDLPASENDSEASATILSKRIGVCDSFAISSPKLIIESRGGRTFEEKENISTLCADINSLVILIPYWYLDAHSTNGPVTDGDYLPFMDEKSPRLHHFFESICELIHSVGQCGASTRPVEVVLLATPYDQFILNSSDMFSRLQQENANKINLAFSRVLNPCTSNNNECVLTESKHNLNLRSPDPVMVVKAINKAVSNFSQTFHRSIAILSSHVIPIGNWLADSQARISKIYNIHIVGNKIITVNDARIINYGYEFAYYQYVGGLEPLLVPRDKYR